MLRGIRVKIAVLLNPAVSLKASIVARICSAVVPFANMREPCGRLALLESAVGHFGFTGTVADLYQ
jgi:hypothetical protein